MWPQNPKTPKPQNPVSYFAIDDLNIYIASFKLNRIDPYVDVLLQHSLRRLPCRPNRLLLSAELLECWLFSLEQFIRALLRLHACLFAHPQFLLAVQT